MIDQELWQTQKTYPYLNIKLHCQLILLLYHSKNIQKLSLLNQSMDWLKKQFLEIPKLLTLVGAGLIIISSVIIFMRESELKKKVVSSRP